MFGKHKGHKIVEPPSSATEVPYNSEDEGWEVVKVKTDQDSSRSTVKKASSAVRTVDVGTSTMTTVMTEEVKRCEKHVQTSSLNTSTSFLEEGSGRLMGRSTVVVDDSTVDLSWDTSSVDVLPGIVPLQEILASLDLTQITEQGNKGLFVVKRNLKTVALLLLLGVFCTGGIPSSRRRSSKRDVIVPPTPTMKDTTTTQKESMDHQERHNRLMMIDDMLMKALQARIVEMEEMNRKEKLELSMMILERDHWRRMAKSCHEELEHTTDMHAGLDEEIKQMKSLVPLHYASSSSTCLTTLESFNASALATTIATTTAIEDIYKVPTRQPSSSSSMRGIPHPQLALPGVEPLLLLPKPVMHIRGSHTTGIVLAPSVALTVS